MKNCFFGRKKRITDLWPKNDAGEPVAPVYLTHCGETQMEAEITVNMLESYGIPVVTQYPNDGSFGKVVLGMAGSGADLYVPENMHEQARELLSGEIIEDDDTL